MPGHNQMKICGIAPGGRIKARESGGGFGIRNRCLFTDARKRTVVESKAFRI